MVRSSARVCLFVLLGLTGALFMVDARAQEQSMSQGLFGFMEISANRISSLPKWVKVLERVKAERPLLERCKADVDACGSPAMRRWHELLKLQAGQGKQAQLKAVNSFFNAYPYITDDKLYGVRDRWATPTEFMKNSGDCEDYAIAKYVTLQLLGWDDSRLRLVVLHDAVRDMPHAVLSADAGGGSASVGNSGVNKFMILDNLATEPLSDRYLVQYSPYYAVNETTRWVYVRPSGLASRQR